MVLHPGGEKLILERMRTSRRTGLDFEPDRPDNLHRLNMGVFPAGARIIPNPFNKIPGFFCSVRCRVGTVYFVPGFPVMAHPMMAWVLDTFYRAICHDGAWMSSRSLCSGPWRRR
jgi:molybdopterin-biosynthesis enzyme MoeA-like protein